MINLSDLDVRLANHRAFVGEIERAHQLGHGSSTLHTTRTRFRVNDMVQRLVALLQSGTPATGNIREQQII
jgi:hypothetical protein